MKMKIFFLISDVNMGLIIGGVIAAVVTPIVSLVLIPYLNKIIAKQDIIHGQMDGMKDELVKTSKALGEATGALQARAEMRIEKKEDDHLKIIEKTIEKKEETIEKTVEKPLPVVVTKNLDKSPPL